MKDILTSFGNLNWEEKRLILSEEYFALISLNFDGTNLPLRLNAVSDRLGETRRRFNVTFLPGIRYEYPLVLADESSPLQLSAALYIWVSKLVNAVAAGIAFEMVIAGTGGIAKHDIRPRPLYQDLNSPDLTKEVNEYSDLIKQDLPGYKWISLQDCATSIDANVTFGGSRPVQVQNILFDNSRIALL